MHDKSIHTVDEALIKLENYCVYRERYHKEVERKINELKMIPEAKEKIILHLIDHNFLNEERYAKAFARGKFRIKKWGKLRIVRELKLRGISKYNIESGLKEISEAEYHSAFHTLSEKKFDSMTEPNHIKKKRKLINYLRYRGWESHLIYEKVNELFK
ncbi:MAG: regulatory protein RecX [Flavobacteriaceae bacterium]|nr:regulatory protein RecX [Flavobacteriaceae bacterium]